MVSAQIGPLDRYPKYAPAFAVAPLRAGYAGGMRRRSYTASLSHTVYIPAKITKLLFPLFPLLQRKQIFNQVIDFFFTHSGNIAENVAVTSFGKDFLNGYITTIVHIR